MKMRMLVCTLAVATAMMLNAGLASAQKKDGKAKPHQPSEAEMQEMMKKWMEVATPGPAHKFLDQFTGKWETTMRMWMGPEATPSESKGECETRWIMDGRFLLGEGRGEMMGMPIRNMLITGYDNFKKQYIVSYLDNMSTGIYTGAGQIDAAGKAITLYGKMDEPLTGEKDKPVKYVTRVISKDKYIFEGYDLVGTPNEFKAFEITFSRKQ